jgi:hypothetical protein
MSKAVRYDEFGGIDVLRVDKVGSGRFPALVRQVTQKRFRNVPGFCCYSNRKPERFPRWAPRATPASLPYQATRP